MQKIFTSIIVLASYPKLLFSGPVFYVENVESGIEVFQTIAFKGC